jgi:uncharacterized RDD family membrane protein YckC
MNCNRCGKEIQINFGPETEPLCAACSESAPADAQTVPEEPPIDDCLASQNKRLVNLLLDFVGLYLFSILVGSIVAVAGWGNIFQNKTVTLNDYLISFAIVVTYYLFFETLFAKTPAKFITHTAVVTEDGYRPGFGDILSRTMYRFFPFDIFSFFSETPVGWHDRFSRTRVVNC